MDEFLDALLPIESQTSRSNRRSKLLRARYNLKLQKVELPTARGIVNEFGANLLDSLSSLSYEKNDSVESSTKDSTSLFDKIGAHFCQRCGTLRTVDNVRVRLRCDKNIRRRVLKIKKKQCAGSKSKNAPELTKVEKTYLKRYGDYCTTRKILCLVCKFKRTEMVRDAGRWKPRLETSATFQPEIKELITVVSATSEKKSKVMREKQKSSAKKCSELKKLLSAEDDRNKANDKRKSLNDFLSLL